MMRVWGRNRKSVLGLGYKGHSLRLTSEANFLLCKEMILKFCNETAVHVA